MSTTETQERVRTRLFDLLLHYNGTGAYSLRDQARLFTEDLAAAGLLRGDGLDGALRERVVAHLAGMRAVLAEANLPKTGVENDALLRALAGESAAPVAATPEPARPRRMRNQYGGEHDEDYDCAIIPPCQPVAEPAPSEHTPMGWTVTPGELTDCAHPHVVAVETVTTTTHTTEGELRLYTPPTATMRVTALYCPTCRARIEVGHGG